MHNQKQLTPIISVVTRWNSTYHMINRFIQQYDMYVICFAEGLYSDEEEIPTREELCTLEAISRTLSFLENFSVFMQGAQYLTLPHTPFVIWKIYDELSSPPSPNTTIIEAQFRKQLLAMAKKYFDEELTTPSQSLLSALLHPLHSKEVQNRIPASLSHKIWVEYVVPWLELVLGDSIEEQDSEECLLPSLFQSERRSPLEKAKEDTDILRKKLFLFQRPQPLTVEELLKESAKKTLSEECSNFYLHLRSSFPHLYHLACLIFSCPATSATSERVFSSSGLIDSPRRARLDPSTLEQLTIIQFFLHKKIRNQIEAKEFVQLLEKYYSDSSSMRKIQEVLVRPEY